MQMTNPAAFPLAQDQIDANIPSINMLQSFRAVAQTASIAQAARQLALPQAVISQHVCALEASLGCVLTHQAGGHVRLSTAGGIVFEKVESLSEVFETDIRRQLLPHSETNAPQKQNTLQIDVLNVQLGLPGLASVLKLWADDLFSFPQPLNFQKTGAEDINSDVVVYFSECPRRDLNSIRLFGEVVVAVAAPNYDIPEYGLTETQLRQEPLLTMATDADYAKWDNWFSDADGGGPAQLPKEPFPNFSSYLQAIKSGRGIGLGLASVMDPHIQSGDIVLASQRQIFRNGSIYAGFDPTGPIADAAHAFCDMLHGFFQIEDVVK